MNEINYSSSFSLTKKEELTEKEQTDKMIKESVSNANLVLREDITSFGKQTVQEMNDFFRIEY